jgi:hypothetical protein
MTAALRGLEQPARVRGLHGKALPEDEHLELCRVVAEGRARGMSFRAIADDQEITVSTAHARDRKWYKELARVVDVEHHRNSLSAKLQWLQQQVLGHYAQVMQVPVSGWPVARGERADLPALQLHAKLGMLSSLLEQAKRNVELEAKVLGVFHESTVTVTNVVSGQVVLGDEAPLPSDPGALERYANLLRSADEIAVDEASEAPPSLPG